MNLFLLEGIQSSEQPLNQFIRSAVHTDDDLGRILDVIEQALQQVKLVERAS